MEPPTTYTCPCGNTTAERKLEMHRRGYFTGTLKYTPMCFCSENEVCRESEIDFINRMSLVREERIAELKTCVLLDRANIHATALLNIEHVGNISIKDAADKFNFQLTHITGSLNRCTLNVLLKKYRELLLIHKSNNKWYCSSERLSFIDFKILGFHY